MATKGWNAIAISFIPLILVSALFGIYLALSPVPSGSATTTINYGNPGAATEGRGYLNPGNYSNYGYPKITYESYSPYFPSAPNYTIDYQRPSIGRFQIGTLVTPAMNLSEAVGLAASYANLNPQNYTLSMADFEPGLIVNNTLVLDPSWILTFARVYDSFWLYGSIGNYESSVSTTVDALTGAVRSVQTSDWSLPPTPQNFHLVINSTQALHIVRTTENFSGVPQALLVNGTVESIEPRIVLLGPTSQNEFFQKPLNTSLAGQYRLCWIVDIYSPVPQFGYSGTFAVDAETGQLDSGDAIMMYPSMQFEYLSSSLNYASASGITVSNETFGISGAMLGNSGTIPVEVQNVVLLKPGSTGRIDLNFSSNLSYPVTLSFSFSNPLGEYQSLSKDNLPQGVSIQFSNPAVVVSSDGTAKTTMEISAAPTDTSGTYILEVVANYESPHSGSSSTTFMISVWNGVGAWPALPTLGQ